MRFCLWSPAFAGTLALWLLAALPVHAAGPDHAIVAGFERFSSGEMTDANGGQLLLGELNCVSCHQTGEGGPARKQAPVLDGVGNRVRVGHLRRFLNDPQAVKPGTTMPHLFADDPARAEKVEALVQYLATTGTPRQERPDGKAIATGRDLYARVGCAACHGPRDAAGLAAKDLPPYAVPLGDLVTKYTLSSLIAFLENPHAVRPSGRMPQVVAGKEARDIANYLLQGIKGDFAVVGQGSTKFTYYEGQWEKLPDFDKLKAVASATGKAFDLGSAKRHNDYGLRFEGFFKVEKEGKYRFSLASDDGSRLFVDGKKIVEVDGIHPVQAGSGEATLTVGIHKVTVQFFQAGGEEVLEVNVEGPGLGSQALGALVAATAEALATKPAPPKKPDDEDALEVKPALVEKGKALFASAGCANCHTMTADKKPVVSTLTASALAKVKPEGGCLATHPVRGLPTYALSPKQRTALAAALKTPPKVSTEPAAVIARTMTTFNCYACHVRDKIGGPTEETNKLFVTTQPEMGDEGRVPPPLDGVGAKLNPEYLAPLLDKGAKDRPYMLTRMPGFGSANVGHLTTALASIDKLDAAPTVKFGDPDAKVKAAGRYMVSGQAFSCAKCHTFNGIKAEGVQGIDMTVMTKRLRRDWFHAYLLNPQLIRPGTRMPVSWPNGKTLLPNLLDGKTPTQIEAIWVYLKDGTKAQTPPGLGKQSIPLVPFKEAIIYRNFIEGAGTRAIGVGYPEKVNLAFDGNECRLAMIWQGAFIDAAKHWTDRGAGFEGPLGDNIMKLQTGAAFAVLDKPETAWPLTTAKEQGWKLTGYHTTADERPTFQYAKGGLKVEDFPNPTVKGSLNRTLSLTTDAASDNLYFRAAVGAKIEALPDGWYQIDGWKMKIEAVGKAQIRLSAGKVELLVPVRFKDGKAQIVQEFVW